MDKPNHHSRSTLLKASALNTSRLLLLGGGGHGQVLLDIGNRCGLHFDGVLDPQLEIGTLIGPSTVIGSDSLLDTLVPSETNLVLGVGLGIDLENRLLIALKYEKRGFSFPTVIAKSATISDNSSISSEGVQAFERTVIQVNAVIDSHAVLNTGAIIEHDVKIGRGSFIGPGSILCGGAQIGEFVMVGSGAVILPQIQVGDGSTIGAGAVVVQNVPSRTRVIGVPAKELKSK